MEIGLKDYKPEMDVISRMVVVLQTYDPRACRKEADSYFFETMFELSI